MREPFTISQYALGVNSLLHPSLISQGEYSWGENVSCRGGIVQTRPGFTFRASIPGTNLQGFTIFKPRDSTPRLVVAVDGKIFVAQWPGFNFVQLANIQFSAAAKRVIFCKTWRSAKTNEDGTLSIITPTPMLFMQDAANRCATWDGVSSRHTDPSAVIPETPQGEWMAWVYSRLWVSRGTRLFVSNIGDPVTFTENTYLAERSNFELPDECTGLIQTSSGQGLLAFSRSSITAFQAGIPNRADWQTTPDFQKVIVGGTGTQSGKSIVNQYGYTWFMSDRGFINLDAALNADRSSRLLTADEGMTRSKRLLASDLSNVCSAGFENMLLVSVPHGSKYNRHTWALDQAPIGARGTGSAWQGIWTGVRPVEWSSGFVGGRERLFFASFDTTPKDDTHIHIWEAFNSRREDGDGGRISCQFETPIIPFDKLSRFKYAEIEVVEMLGNVDLQIYAGGEKGPWVPIGSATMQAEKGSIGSQYQKVLTNSSLIQTFKPQSRTIKSSEFPKGDSVDCTPETSGNVLGIDKGFAILLQWQGRMGVKKIRLYLDPETTQSKTGGCEESEAGEHNAIDESGEEVIEVLFI